MAAYPPRNKVEKSQTWNAESVFRNQRAWQAELEAILADVDLVKRFQGRLGEGPSTLLEALTAYEQLIVRVERVYMYANFSHAVDTSDQRAAGMVGKAGAVFGQVAAAATLDDLLATGGTAEAVGKLVLRQGAELVGYSFVVELSFLHGARRLGTQKVDTLVTF